MEDVKDCSEILAMLVKTQTDTPKELWGMGMATAHIVMEMMSYEPEYFQALVKNLNAKYGFEFPSQEGKNCARTFVEAFPLTSIS